MNTRRSPLILLLWATSNSNDRELSVAHRWWLVCDGTDWCAILIHVIRAAKVVAVNHPAFFLLDIYGLAS